MKAAILVENNKPLIVADISLPIELYYGQVLVRIHYSTICGSQIGEIDAAKGADKFLPHLLGHEGGGVVEKIGPGVTRVKPGDHVVMHWRKAAGIEAPTPKYRWGEKIVNAGWVTTFSEKAIISENRLTPVPKTLDLKLASLFGCAIPTAFGVINNDAQVKIGESVVIFGLGGVGVNIVQAASLVSAYPIVGVDLNDEKIALAKAFGLTHGFNASNQPAMLATLKEIVGENGADVVIDATGNPRVIEMAYALTHSAGKTILVGVPKAGDNISIYSLPLHFEKSLKGSHGGDAVPDKDIPRYLKLLETNKMALDGLITHEFPLNEINQALDVVRSGQAGRVLLNMLVS